MMLGQVLRFLTQIYLTGVGIELLPPAVLWIINFIFFIYPSFNQEGAFEIQYLFCQGVLVEMSAEKKK